MQYTWILFDADDTLFDFHLEIGFNKTLQHFAVQPQSAEDFSSFTTVNRSLWTQYQNGEITAFHLKTKRFEPWAKLAQVEPIELHQFFLTHMSSISKPLAGTREFLEQLHGQVKFGIITNGFVDLQNDRLTQTELNHYFDFVITSEEIGFAKPHQAIFAAALNKMGNPDPKTVLMVGDNVATDILGGANAGMDTCWLNTHAAPLTIDVQPTLQVTSLIQLADCLS